MNPKLTNEQKRIKIAEACGYALIPWDSEDFFYLNPTDTGRVLARDGNMTGALRVNELPDYFNDLNAMHEAFKSLKLVQQCKWHQELRKLLKRKLAHNIDDASIDWLCDNASAAQRAEVFGLTLGLWKEGE